MAKAGCSKAAFNEEKVERLSRQGLGRAVHHQVPDVTDPGCNGCITVPPLLKLLSVELS
jgi:hypothetical protein